MAAEFFKWDSTYNLGLKDIDKQHQKMVDIINKLYNAFLQREEKNKMQEIIEEMLDYAKKHFKTEEEYFDKYGYEDKDQHLKLHEAYAKKAQEFEEKHKDGINVTYAVMSFLKNWWSDHILYADKKYMKSFIEKGHVEV